MPLRELGGLARRLAIGRGRLRCRLLALGVRLERGELLGVLGDVRDRLAELDLDAFLEELDDRSGARRFDLDRRLRRLDDADRLALRHFAAVLDEPFGEQRELGVRVLAREDDLEHALLSHAFESDDRLDDVVRARQHRVLERARRRDDPVARGHPLHRPA